MGRRGSLQQLTDEQEIRDLARLYCTAVDRRDWRLLGEIFVPDATVDVGSSSPMRGTGEIVSRYRRGLSKYDSTHHMVTNHEITVDGDTAGHRCLVHAQHVRPAAAAGNSMFTIGGRYQDRLVRTPHGWRFRHRELVTVWSEGGSAP